MLTEKSVRGLAAQVSRWALACAVVAGFFTWHAIDGPLQEAGMGLIGTVLAFLGAAAMTAAYGAFVHVAINGVAPLPAGRRGLAAPAIVAGTVLLMLGSAYPNVIVTGGATAVAIEDRSYIANAAEVGDALKAGAQAVLSVEAVIDSALAQLEVFERGEADGVTSGSPLAGQLANFARGRIMVLRRAKADLRPAQERITDEMARFDAAIDKMRAALILEGKTQAERRVLLQRAGDEARLAGIGIGAAAPIVALEALADSLIGPQIEPKWSANPEIRRNQQEGYHKIKDELRRIGKSIKHRVNDLGQAVKRGVPVYDPLPTSILVLKHAKALTNIYALFLTLDGLPFVLYLVACAMFDAVRRRDGDDALPSGPSGQPSTPGSALLGPHPHPNATAARTSRSEKTKEDA